MGYIGRDFESHLGWCGIVAWHSFWPRGTYVRLAGAISL